MNISVTLNEGALKGTFDGAGDMFVSMGAGLARCGTGAWRKGAEKVSSKAVERKGKGEMEESVKKFALMKKFLTPEQTAIIHTSLDAVYNAFDELAQRDSHQSKMQRAKEYRKEIKKFDRLLYTTSGHLIVEITETSTSVEAFRLAETCVSLGIEPLDIVNEMMVLFGPDEDKRKNLFDSKTKPIPRAEVYSKIKPVAEPASSPKPSNGLETTTGKSKKSTKSGKSSGSPKAKGGPQTPATHVPALLLRGMNEGIKSELAAPVLTKAT